MRRSCTCKYKGTKSTCECNGRPGRRVKASINNNTSACITPKIRDHGTSLLFARRNSILLFCSSLLVFLSGSSEALANSFCSYSRANIISKANALNSSYHLSKESDIKNSLPKRHGWFSRSLSQSRLPLLSSFRGGSLEPLSSNPDDIPMSVNGTSRKESKPTTDNDQTTRQQQQQLQIFAAATSMPDDQQYPCSYIAEADLPTDIGNFRLRAYRITDNAGEVDGGMQKNKWLGTEPCLIYCKDKPLFTGPGKNVPIRIHDQCFTSEVFRSQRCDCKEQLNMALKYIKKNGGAIIYLQQEGRGIGLANKVAAYALQDLGFDTVDANTHLGFPEDCRQYGVVPSILRDMGIASIRLITNNPRKTDRLRALGVDVEGTIPMVVPSANPHNARYLETKKNRMNHSNLDNLFAMENGAASVPDPPTATDLDSTDKVVNMALNGMMKPRKKPVEESAAIAVKAALTSDSISRGGNSTPPGVDTAPLGVTAAADGYCMGRQSVEDAIAAVARGEIVVVVDDMDRENEGDFIMAADLATPEAIAIIVRHSSGVICVGMEGKTMDRLELPAMLVNNEDPKGTAFSVTVDGAPECGITTGISAKERAITIRLLSDDSTQPIDLRRPGHIFPLRAREGGVLARDGHTEASVDLARLAGCHPSGVLCEIVSEEHPTEMARLPELARMCEEKGWVMTSIVDIAQYRRDVEDL